MARLGRGRRVRHGGARRRPEALLELWSYEACPPCRTVREALSELDLDWIAHPTPRGSGLRASSPAPGAPYPQLRDPSTGFEAHGAAPILEHLHGAYGAGRPHSARFTAPLDAVGSVLASAMRPRALRTAFGDRVQPAQRLELFQYEGCPYSRKVRERLDALCLELVVRNVAKGSRSRPRLVALGGKMQVPFLVDPNTGVALYESDDILAYLDDVYAR